MEGATHFIEQWRWKWSYETKFSLMMPIKMYDFYKRTYIDHEDSITIAIFKIRYKNVDRKTTAAAPEAGKD